MEDVDIAIVEVKVFDNLDQYLDITGLEACYVKAAREGGLDKCHLFMAYQVYKSCDNLNEVTQLIHAEKHVYLGTFYIAPTEEHKGYIVRGNPTMDLFLIIPIDQFPEEIPEEFVPAGYLLASPSLPEPILAVVDQIHEKSLL